MKKAKLVKTNTKNEEVISEQYSIKSMIKIILVLFLIIGIFYAITYFVVNRPKDIQKDETHTVIDTEKITVSQILNQKEEEYYVLATMESLYKDNGNYTADYIELYNEYILKYQQQGGKLKFYRIDLDSAFNKKYISDETSITENISDIKISDEVLIRIKNGKIDKYYLGHTDIADKLSRL